MSYLGVQGKYLEEPSGRLTLLLGHVTKVLKDRTPSNRASFKEEPPKLNTPNEDLSTAIIYVTVGRVAQSV